MRPGPGRLARAVLARAVILAAGRELASRGDGKVEELERELLESLKLFLRRARHDPKARFEEGEP